jgi:sugar/nucleoside kinase (ribokinase family)
MYNSLPLEKIDYLVIGHLSHDLTPNGTRIGGTAAYSALTARALGLKVGIVTSWNNHLPLGPLEGIPIVSFPSEVSTTFENIYTPHGRIQVVHQVANQLDFHHIPETWRYASIVHLGPIAQEVEPGMVRRFPSALIGLTPQGWLRHWDQAGHVKACEWAESSFILQQAGAAVISIEDVDGDEERVEEMASACRVLAVTEANHGARVFWNGDVRRFRPPIVEEVEATGAGDVFAASFFARLFATRNPWEAGRYATQLSAYSVTRQGLDSPPTPSEIQSALIEVL